MIRKILLPVATFFILSPAVWSETRHTDYATGMEIKSCNECHVINNVAPNHGSFWVKEHRLWAEKQTSNCKDCHQLSFCQDCHEGGGLDADLHVSTSGVDYMPKSHRTDFREIHPIKAQEDPRSCYRCHDAVRFCAQCHDRFPKGTLSIKSHQMLGPNGQKYAPAIGQHSMEARRNLTSCQSCHPDGDVCIQCHSSGKTSPHPRGWSKISGRLRSASGQRSCLKCHLPGTF